MSRLVWLFDKNTYASSKSSLSLKTNMIMILLLRENMAIAIALPIKPKTSDCDVRINSRIFEWLKNAGYLHEEKLSI